MSDEDIPRCCICLESLGDARDVCLPCCHRFHGQCLVNYFMHNRSCCPLCRYSEERESDSDEDSDVQNEGITQEEALIMARADVSTDARLARMFATNDSLKEERERSHTVYLSLKRQLHRLKRKSRKAFNIKQASLICQVQHERQEFHKVSNRLKASTQRIAKKYGWTGDGG